MISNKLKGIITFVLILVVLTIIGSTVGETNYVPINYQTISESMNSASDGDTIVAFRHIVKAERVIAQDLNYGPPYARGDQTIFSKGVKGDLVINDSIGDVAYDFIDIKQGIVSVDGTNLIAKIQLENIPKQLLFDKTNVTDNYCEYEWSLYIDIDNNTFTGCSYDGIGTEYAVSCSHFKFPGSIPHYDLLINGTQHDVWVYNTSDEFWERGTNYEVYAYVDYDTNTLTMVATPFNSTILNTSKFYIITGYRDRTRERDFAPPVPTVPKSQIHVHKTEYLLTHDTYINHDKIYNFAINWSANVWEAENLDNVSYTITTSKNFTYINNWEFYQNGTVNSFISLPTIEGQNYTWALPLKDRIGSNINFDLDSSQTIQDNPWVDMDVNTTNEGYTRVNVTFTPVVPLNWINIYVRGDQIINVSAYSPEFEIAMLTSNYVKFDSGDINQDQEYNFSVLVDKPNEVFLWLEDAFGWVVESPSNIITLPVAELGSVTVKADVPIIWEHEPTMPGSVQSITIKFEEITETIISTNTSTNATAHATNIADPTPVLPTATASAINRGDQTIVVLGWSQQLRKKKVQPIETQPIKLQPIEVQPEEGNKFIMVDIVLINHGSETLRIRSVDRMKLKDANNHEYMFESNLKSIRSVGSPFFNILPGDRVRGQVLFQVPEASSDYVFIYDLSSGSDTDIVEVPLGTKPFALEPPIDLLTPDYDTHQIGTIVSNGDLAFRVIGWESISDNDKYPLMPESMRFVVLDIELKNQGQQLLKGGDWRMELKDITGERYEFDSLPTGRYGSYDICIENIRNNLIAPGEHMRGKVSFRVPQDINNLIFVLGVLGPKPTDSSDPSFWDPWCSKAFVEIGQNPVTVVPPVLLSEEQRIHIHTINEPVQVDSFLITVTGVTFSEESSVEDAKCVIIDINGHNIGSESAGIIFVGLRTSLKDEMGQYYSDSTMDFNIDFNDDVAVGETVSGRFSWIVPKETNELFLVIQKENGQKVFISLSQ